MSVSEQSFLPLKGVWFQILLTLAEEPRHGYAIRQAVGRRTEGKVRLWPTTLYGALADLSQAGLIEETEEDGKAEDNLGRIRYRLTGLGAQVLDAEAKRLEDLVLQVRAARGALSG